MCGSWYVLLIGPEGVFYQYAFPLAIQIAAQSSISPPISEASYGQLDEYKTSPKMRRYEVVTHPSSSSSRCLYGEGLGIASKAVEFPPYSQMR